MTRKLQFCLCAIFLLATNAYSQEQTQKPKWEFGIGLGAANFPHYPGADQSERLVTPFPYPQYNGKWLKVDDNGVAARFFSSDNVKLSISANASFPIDSDDNRAREGMEDLEFIAEIGPEIEITLKQWEKSKLRLDLPIRAAFEVTLDEAPKDVGFNFDPRVHYEREINKWNVEFDLGALFGNSRYHKTFYEVGAEDITITRPSFTARSGQTGWRFSSTAKRRWGNWIVLGYLRYMNLSNAENRESPLLISDDYLTTGIALVRII